MLTVTKSDFALSLRGTTLNHRSKFTVLRLGLRPLRRGKEIGTLGFSLGTEPFVQTLVLRALASPFDGKVNFVDRSFWILLRCV